MINDLGVISLFPNIGLVVFSKEANRIKKNNSITMFKLIYFFSERFVQKFSKRNRFFNFPEKRMELSLRESTFTEGGQSRQFHFFGLTFIS